MCQPMFQLASQVGAQRATVLVVHGVGLGASHYTRVAELIATRTAVLVPERPGYARGHDGDLLDYDEHVDALVAILDECAAGPAVYVGVSGGATLGIGVLAKYPQRFCGAVLHEPLLGSFAPELQGRVVAAAERLAADPDPAASGAFVRQLVGERAWESLDRRDLDEVLDRDPVIRHEATMFAAVDFTHEQLERLRAIPLVTTVGRASPDRRHRAAERFAELTGARVDRIPGDHFVPVTGPGGLAAAVESIIGAPRSEVS